MRQWIKLASLCLVLALVGCAHEPKPRIASTAASTSLPPVEDVAALNARANDAGRSQEERARAVFTLFAHQVRPGASAADIRRVLPNPIWVTQTHLYAGDELRGWIPLGVTAEDTVFQVHLFPSQQFGRRESPWQIYLRLTGRFLEYEDAVAFLKGERSSWNPKLVEFALCFPEASGSNKSAGRIEVFSAEGIRVYEEK